MSFLRKLIDSDVFIKIVLVIIYLFLIQNLFLKGKFSTYCYTDSEYNYEYVKFFSRAFVFIGLILSLSYPLIVYLKEKEKFKNKLILVVIGFLPALYHIILLALTLVSN